METSHQKPKRNLPIAWILTACFVPFVLAGIWLATQIVSSATVSGSATVFDDVPVDLKVQGFGFGVEGRPKKTTIEAGGRVIEFLDSHRVLVDGVEVGVIDESVERIAMKVGPDGISIESEGKMILTYR